jgi:hypothetical protein
MAIEIVRAPIPLDAVRRAAQEQFGDFVKAVVDVRQELMAIGGELHAMRRPFCSSMEPDRQTSGASISTRMARRRP